MHIVRILFGFPCTIKLHHSPVVIHVPGGRYGVILGNVYENFETLKNFVKENDCIVSPLCELEFHGFGDIPKGAWIKIQVPHIVKNPKIQDNIKVLSRDRYQESIEYAQKLLPGQEPPDHRHIYYRFCEETIEIFTQHFSQFIVYAKNCALNEVMGTNVSPLEPSSTPIQEKKPLKRSLSLPTGCLSGLDVKNTECDGKCYSFKKKIIFSFVLLSIIFMD